MSAVTRLSQTVQENRRTALPAIIRSRGHRTVRRQFEHRTDRFERRSRTVNRWPQAQWNETLLALPGLSTVFSLPALDQCSWHVQRERRLYFSSFTLATSGFTMAAGFLPTQTSAT